MPPELEVRGSHGECDTVGGCHAPLAGGPWGCGPTVRCAVVRAVLREGWPRATALNSLFAAGIEGATPHRILSRSTHDRVHAAPPPSPLGSALLCSARLGAAHELITAQLCSAQLLGSLRHGAHGSGSPLLSWRCSRRRNQPACAAQTRANKARRSRALAKNGPRAGRVRHCHSRT